MLMGGGDRQKAAPASCQQLSMNNLPVFSGLIFFLAIKWAVPIFLYDMRVKRDGGYGIAF
jgi:hypothetical protein